jgi:hypothetical protein
MRPWSDGRGRGFIETLRTSGAERDGCAHVTDTLGHREWVKASGYWTRTELTLEPGRLLFSVVVPR